MASKPLAREEFVRIESDSHGEYFVAVIKTDPYVTPSEKSIMLATTHGATQILYGSKSVSVNVNVYTPNPAYKK